MPRGKPAKPAPAAPRDSAIARRRVAAREEGSAAYVERRREIIAAAAQVFKKKGLQGSNLGDVALAAGADRASLYYYVESKEELFHEVVREAVQTNLAQARALRDGEGTVVQKLRTLIVALMESYAANYPILYVYIQENLSQVPEEHAGWAAGMRRANKEYERILMDLVDQGVEEGTFRVDAPAWLVTYGILGMLGWTNRWFNPEDSPLSATEIGAAFADLLLRGMERPARTRQARTA